jgi:hypothetical protein
MVALSKTGRERDDLNNTSIDVLSVVSILLWYVESHFQKQSIGQDDLLLILRLHTTYTFSVSLTHI